MGTSIRRKSRGFRLGARLLQSALVCAALLVAGCGGGGGSSGVGGATGIGFLPTSLNQAAYRGGNVYEYGYRSFANIDFTGAPADTDYSRWAMLHDGSTYRLFFGRLNRSSIYQFGYNPASGDYEYGFNSIDEIAVTGFPADADRSSFKMLHDGARYRIFMRSLSDPRNLYQGAFNSSTGSYVYGFASIDRISTTGLPADADLSRWAMLYDGSVYRQYVGRVGRPDAMYQCGFDGRTYDFGHRSISSLSISGMPASSDTRSVSMLHDGTDYRLFHLSD